MVKDGTGDGRPSDIFEIDGAETESGFRGLPPGSTDVDAGRERRSLPVEGTRRSGDSAEGPMKISTHRQGVVKEILSDPTDTPLMIEIDGLTVSVWRDGVMEMVLVRIERSKNGTGGGPLHVNVHEGSDQRWTLSAK